METLMKKILPEPWISMTEAQLAQMKEPEARQMLAAVSTPELSKFRQDVRSLRTSELIMLLTHGGQLAAKVLPPDAEDIRVKRAYDNEEEQLIIAAGAIMLGDEIDRRVPRP
jgi:hypothetical protein